MPAGDTFKQLLATAKKPTREVVLALLTTTLTIMLQSMIAKPKPASPPQGSKTTMAMTAVKNKFESEPVGEGCLTCDAASPAASVEVSPNTIVHPEYFTIVKPDSSKATSLLTHDELTDRIVWATGVYETNRDGNEPTLKESELNTTAGVSASFATINQSTMQWVVANLMGNRAARENATPPLTGPEVYAANNTIIAVNKITKLIEISENNNVSISTFLANNRNDISLSYLSDQDINTIWNSMKLEREVIALHKKLIDLHGNIKKTPAMELDKAIKELQNRDGGSLGLNYASLSGYIKNPKNWGENRSAWHRKAVSNMPNSVGRRLEEVATKYGGQDLHKFTVKKYVSDISKSNTSISRRDLIIQTSQKNNPGEQEYGQKVLKIYEEQFGPI